MQVILVLFLAICLPLQSNCIQGKATSPPILLVQKSLIFVRIKEAIFVSIHHSPNSFEILYYEKHCIVLNFHVKQPRIVEFTVFRAEEFNICEREEKNINHLHRYISLKISRG